MWYLLLHWQMHRAVNAGVAHANVDAEMHLQPDLHKYLAPLATVEPVAAASLDQQMDEQRIKIHQQFDSLICPRFELAAFYTKLYTFI